MTQNPSTILIVDDEESIREMLASVLEIDGHHLMTAGDGQDALRQATEFIPDLVLLDVMLPDLDGFEVCRRLRVHPILDEVPIIMMTGMGDHQARLRSLEAGADEFLSKPFDPIELQARVRTITRFNRYRRLLQERTKFEQVVEFSPDGIVIVDQRNRIRMANPVMLKMLGAADEAGVLEQSLLAFIAPDQVDACRDRINSIQTDPSQVMVLETSLLGLDGRRIPVEVNSASFTFGDQVGAQIIVRDITRRKRVEEQLQHSHRELVEAYEATIEGWSQTLNLRDHETKEHAMRVTEMTLCLARNMGIDDEELVHLRRGALLHDIGKLGIPDQILLKPGPLTEAEWEIMRQHPVYAFDMLSPIQFLEPALAIPYYHHEKWDGSGYPLGLTGEEIPLAARIFAIVDVWDALCSDRPYRSAWSRDKVMDYIRQQTGQHFDPGVVETFVRLNW
jgi:PAS domain S-box-containing protein